ncbi:hypothetical protein ACH436_14930 [Isoptericola sp. NPDC019693]|uniref:hypothetical protein n=1 Tax=Isoptericola sp. NPDC019693 TaxID=3364009 RepID=UPI0037AE9403
MTDTIHRTTIRRRRRRGVLAAVAGAALALAAGLGGAVPAQADVLDATCTGTTNIAYSPGIKLVAATVDVTDTTSFSCTTSKASINRGHLSNSSTGVERGCLSVGATSFNRTVYWSDYSTSDLTGTSTTANIAGNTVETITGTVSGGRFEDDTFVLVRTLPNIAGLLDCLTTTGLTQVSGTSVLTITGL